MQRTQSHRRESGRAAVALLALIATCLAPPVASADTVKVKAELTTSAELNPDYRGRPSPVVLFVFQLKAADAFNNADFYSLQDGAAGVLGGDLIGQTQMTLQPGEMRPFEAEFDEEARFIGLVAAFRDIEQAQWRSLVELPDKGFFRSVFSREKLMISVDKLAVTAVLD